MANSLSMLLTACVWWWWWNAVSCLVGFALLTCLYCIPICLAVVVGHLSPSTLCWMMIPLIMATAWQGTLESCLGMPLTATVLQRDVLCWKAFLFCVLVFFDTFVSVSWCCLWWPATLPWSKAVVTNGCSNRACTRCPGTSSAVGQRQYSAIMAPMQLYLLAVVPFTCSTCHVLLIIVPLHLCQYGCCTYQHLCQSSTHCWALYCFGQVCVLPCTEGQ